MALYPHGDGLISTWSVAHVQYVHAQSDDIIIIIIIIIASKEALRSGL
jgi:hypothetical protein